MATLTDTLETLFEVRGVEGLVGGLGHSAKGFLTAAAAEVEMTAATLGLETVLGPLALAFGALAVVIGATLGTLEKSVEIFAEDEQILFRAGIALKDLGSKLPISQLQAFGQELQRTIAVDDEAVVGVAGLLKEFEVSDAAIEPTIRTILDYAKATGVDLPQAASTFTRALLGQARGLKAIGIDFKATGDRAADLARLTGLLQARTRGAAEAQANTLGGSFEKLQESINNFLSSLGKLAAPGLVSLFKTLTSLFDSLTHALEALIKLGEEYHLIAAGDAVNAAGAAAETPATAEGNRYLKTIADNTGETVKAITFGKGTRGREALSVRDIQLAVGR